MRLLRRFAVVVPALLATIVVAGAPASATTCPTGGGALMTIQRCADTSTTEDVIFGFAGPATFGHFEIWKYGTTQFVNSNDATWPPGGGAFHNVPWNARTCIEFWKKSGSNWVRMNGEIDCTSS